MSESKQFDTPSPTPANQGNANREPQSDEVAGYRSNPPKKSPEPHMVMSNSPKSFGKGLSAPPTALKFLLGHRELWAPALWPTLINIVLFVFFVVLALLSADDVLESIWSQPSGDAWYGVPLVALWWAALVVVAILLVAVSYVLVMLLGGVVASPFNDALSKKTERLRFGDEREGLHKATSVARGMWDSMVSSAVVAGLNFVLWAPLLLLNLIPGLGSMAYLVCAGIVGAYFVALEYCDTFLERQGLTLREKLHFVWRHRAYTFGFGLGMNLFLWIPLMGFLSIPVAVIGGTILGRSLVDAEDVQVTSGKKVSGVVDAEESAN